MGQDYRVWTALAVLFVSLVAIRQADAYTPTLSPTGRSVRWFGATKLNLAGNPSNASGLSDSAIYTSAVRGLQRWREASNNSVAFDYWQGSNPSFFRASSDYNSYSNLFFASASTGSGVSPSILGLTQVWYNTDSGEILETDIVLNDRDFRFTTNPKDTSGYGAGSTSYYAGKPNVYIENVLTHELGHAFGLSHSSGLQSTMLFMESPEQAHLGCDDQLGIQAVYGGGVTGARGAVSGTVVSPAGAPVFGAHVQAISGVRGAVLASGITDSAGYFQIGALEPGTYYLMVEPFMGGAQALPAYFRGINPNVCDSGRAFARTFLTQAGGSVLMPVRVAAGQTVTAPPLGVRCSSGGLAAVDATARGSLTQILDGTRGETGFGLVDLLDRDRMKSYSIKGVSGHLAIHVMSFSLYSPIEVQARLTDSAGREGYGVTVQRAYQGDSGYVNYDLSLEAEHLPPGDYTLWLWSSGEVGMAHYPAGPILLDGAPFVVVAGAQNADKSPAGVPAGARCRMGEIFSSYQSPAGDPQRSEAQTEPEGTGFCGTIQSGSGLPPAPPSAGSIAGWLLPWMLMGLMARGFRRISACDR